MKDLMGKKVLITTTEWFYAPDGRQYRAVYGTLNAINTSEATLGFTPSRTNTNWFLQIGNVIVAGCQVKYCVKAPACNTGETLDETTERTVESKYGPTAESFTRGSHIYKAD